MNPSTSILPNPNLLVQHTGTIRGRGVFTLAPYAAGSIVEVCPVIDVHFPWDDLPGDVKRVVYDWGYLTGQPEGQVSGIALGVGSLFNHRDHPSLSYHADLDRKALVFTAIHDIEAGEELTINYNGDIDPALGTNWFEMVGIEQLP